MQYDTKVAVLVRDDLAAWQRLNVTAFLAGGLVGAAPELAGQPYQDGSGAGYGPLIRQPVLVFAASAEGLRGALERARARGLVPSIYTTELFGTGNDADNRAAVAACETGQLDLVGLGLHGARKDVDTATKGLRLHP